MDLQGWRRWRTRLETAGSRRSAVGLGLAGVLGLTAPTTAKKNGKKKKKGKKKNARTLVCAAPAVACAGQCVTLDTTSNCGACGRRCAAGQSCVGGACRSANDCGNGETACGALCCGSDEVCQHNLVCAACGGSTEPCCAGNTCDGGLTCVVNVGLCGPNIPI
ncbi:MAG: hypothetical protein QM692_12390 [Thermomicrobiales bacterium]